MTAATTLFAVSTVEEASLTAPPVPTLVCRWRLSYIIPLEEATAAKSPCCAGKSQPQNAPNTGVLYNV